MKQTNMPKKKLRTFIFSGYDKMVAYKAKTLSDAQDMFLNDLTKKEWKKLKEGDQVVVEEVVSVMTYKGDDEMGHWTEINE